MLGYMKKVGDLMSEPNKQGSGAMGSVKNSMDNLSDAILQIGRTLNGEPQPPKQTGEHIVKAVWAFITKYAKIFTLYLTLFYIPLLVVFSIVALYSGDNLALVCYLFGAFLLVHINMRL